MPTSGRGTTIIKKRAASRQGRGFLSIKAQLAASGRAHVLVKLKASVKDRALESGSLPKVWEALLPAFVDGGGDFDSLDDLGGGCRLRRVSRPTPHPLMTFPRLGLAFGSVDEDGLKIVCESKKVEAVAALPTLEAIRGIKKPKDAKAADLDPWPAEMMGAHALWELGLSGSGVRVGHLDTGIDGRHPCLKSAIRAFVVMDSIGRREKKRVVPYEDHPSGHGTHTAAIIAGREVGGRPSGMAPKAELFGAVVIEGGNFVGRVIGGLEWAVESNVRIVNLSLGLPGRDSAFLMVIDALRENAVLPVVAIGNRGKGITCYPGNYPNVLSVGAVDKHGKVPTFSSSERLRRRRKALMPDIVAPGTDIVSAAPGGRYCSQSGSSMAAAHISGLAALLIEAHPRAGVDAIEMAILKSARPTASMERERGNRGVPNGPRALHNLERMKKKRAMSRL